MGKRPLQINGVGFTGGPSDQKVMIKSTVGSTTVTSQGPSVNRDFAFKSDMGKGILYYEVPSVKDILGSTLGSKLSSLNTELYVQGPLIDGNVPFFNWDQTSQCSISYSMARTPQVNRVYPSVVYPTQGICFNVFTDYAASDSKNYYTSSDIGGYSLSFAKYDSDNQLVSQKSEWKYKYYSIFLKTNYKCLPLSLEPKLKLFYSKNTKSKGLLVYSSKTWGYKKKKLSRFSFLGKT